MNTEEKTLCGFYPERYTLFGVGLDSSIDYDVAAARQEVFAKLGDYSLQEDIEAT